MSKTNGNGTARSRALRLLFYKYPDECRILVVKKMDDTFVENETAQQKHYRRVNAYSWARAELARRHWNEYRVLYLAARDEGYSPNYYSPTEVTKECPTCYGTGKVVDDGH